MNKEDRKDLVERLKDSGRNLKHIEMTVGAQWAVRALSAAEQAIHEAAAELARLRRELSRRRSEDAAAVLFLKKMAELVPIRDVMTATATVGTLIDYYAAAIRKEPTHE